MLNLKNITGFEKTNNPELVYVCNLLDIEHKTNTKKLEKYIRPEYKSQAKMEWHEDHVKIVDTGEIIKIKTIRKHANTFHDPDDGWCSSYNYSYEIVDMQYSRNRAKQLFFDYDYQRKRLLLFKKINIDQVLKRFWSIIELELNKS